MKPNVRKKKEKSGSKLTDAKRLKTNSRQMDTTATFTRCKQTINTEKIHAACKLYTEKEIDCTISKKKLTA